MKKITIGLMIAAVAALAFAGIAMAQTPNTDMLQYGNGNGNGTRTNGSTTTDSILHVYIVDFFADAFGISADELNTRLDSGETLSAIAISLGYSVEETQLMMDDARLYALDEALADGIITELQYDQMLAAGTGGAYNGSTHGQGRGSGGSRSQSGSQDGTGDCVNILP